MIEEIKAKRQAKARSKFGAMEDVADGVHKHEKHLHPGKPLTKLKSGGVMCEKKTHARLDKLKRGGKPMVNVIIQNEKPEPLPPMGAPITPPVAPPMAGPVNGPVPGMKTGGKMGGVKSIGEGMTAGAASGEGRLEKIDLQKKVKKD